MAKQSIRCPHCGDSTEFEPGKQTVFCQQFGKAIALATLEQARPLPDPAEAERAFDSGDYLEAYTLYGRLLEAGSDSHRAQFRRGLCAGHLSSGRDLRLQEVLEGYEKACATLERQLAEGRLQQDFALSEQQAMCNALVAFGIGSYRTLERVRAKPVFDSQQEAAQFANSVRDCVKLLDAVDELTADEKSRKQLYTARIEACELGLRCEKLRYKQPTTDKNGAPTEQILNYKVGKEYIGFMQQKRQNAVDDYNALPSISQLGARIQTDIDAEKNTIEAYQQKRKRFLNASPELKKQLRKGRLLICLITLGVCALCVLAACLWSHWLLLALIPIGLVLWSALRIYTNCFEKKNFSATLLRDRAEFRRSRRQLRKKKEEQSQFRSKTMKK